MNVGLSSELTVKTAEKHATWHLGENVPVYSTTAMIGLMEWASTILLRPYLEEEEGSVGVQINVRHMAPTAIGMKVTARLTVLAVNDRKITFAVEAYNEKEKIGEGTYECAIIHVGKFASKIRRVNGESF